MKKQTTRSSQATSPARVVWEQTDKFLSPADQNAAKRKLLEEYANHRTIVVADNYGELSNENRTVVSVEEQLSEFNHFDLPFGCQQPTAAHAQILGSLIKSALLPETPLETVISFLRHMYHQYSSNGQPQLFRLVDAHKLPFFEQWHTKYTWLEEFDREPWWDVSKRLSDLGHHEDALLAHYQAMPTSVEFEKVLKDMCNFESTSDGRWFSSTTATAAKKVDRPGLGVYGAQINLKTTKTQMPENIVLQLNNRNSVVQKTKSVERFLCAMLMVYRATSSRDVVKHIQTLAQNLYIGNPDFDLVDPPRLEEVLHRHTSTIQTATTIVWDQIDIPLTSPEIQELWVTLSMATLSEKSAVVFGEGLAAKSMKSAQLQWYDDTSHTPVNNLLHWVCFSSVSEVKFSAPITVAKDVVSSIEEWAGIFRRV